MHCSVAAASQRKLIAYPAGTTGICVLLLVWTGLCQTCKGRQASYALATLLLSFAAAGAAHIAWQEADESCIVPMLERMV